MLVTVVVNGLPVDEEERERAGALGHANALAVVHRGKATGEANADDVRKRDAFAKRCLIERHRNGDRAVGDPAPMLRPRPSSLGLDGLESYWAQESVTST